MERGKEYFPGGRRWRKAGVCFVEKAALVLCLGGIYLEVGASQ